MNFENENTFDLNDILDRLDEVGHQQPSDDCDRSELFNEVQA